MENIQEFPALTKENAVIGKLYAFCGMWQKLVHVYRITEQEARNSGQMFLDRCETIDWLGNAHNFAIPGSDILEG